MGGEIMVDDNQDKEDHGLTTPLSLEEIQEVISEIRY